MKQDSKPKKTEQDEESGNNTNDNVTNDVKESTVLKLPTINSRRTQNKYTATWNKDEKVQRMQYYVACVNK